MAGLYARLRSNYDFIYRRFGDEGLTLIEEMGREYGKAVADRAAKHLKNNELESVASYLIRIFDTMGHGEPGFIETIREGNSRVVIRVSRCPLNFQLPAMCQAHTAMERTVVESLNPELSYRIGSSIPAGHAFCEHIIEIPK